MILFALGFGILIIILFQKINKAEADIDVLRKIISAREAGERLREKSHDVKRDASFVGGQVKDKVEGVVNGSPVAPRVVVSEKAPLPPIYTDSLSRRGERSLVDRFSAWLKEDFLVKLGGFLLLLALLWFVSYAIVNKWIDPLGQILVGLIASISCVIVGVSRMRTFVKQGAVFTGVGTSGVLISMYAARHIYQLFSPASALFIMGLAVSFLMYVSVRYRIRSTANAGLVMAGIIPLLLGTPVEELAPLMSYLLVVVGATLLVVHIRGWSHLIVGAVTLVFFYSFPFFSIGANEMTRETGLLFAFIFTLLFFSANIYDMLKQENKAGRGVHLAVASLTGLYLFMWIGTFAHDYMRGILFVIWALIFAGGGFIVYCLIERKAPFYIYGGTSMLFLGFATTELFHDASLTLAFTFETLLLVYLAGKLLRSLRVLSLLSALYILPMIFSIMNFASTSWERGVLHKDFFVILCIGLALGFTAWFAREMKRETMDQRNDLWKIHFAFSGVYFASLLWLSLEGAIQNDQIAHTIALIIYTIVGLIAYISGARTERKGEKAVGVALLSFVVCHLLLFEASMMNTGERIITFFVIGLLFVSTAFLKEKGIQTKKFMNATDSHE